MKCHDLSKKKKKKRSQEKYVNITAPLWTLFWKIAENFRKTVSYRRSRLQMFFKIGDLKNFANFTAKHLRWSLFSIKFQSWRPATLLKRGCNTGAFLWNLQNFKKTFFYRTTPVAAPVCRIPVNGWFLQK